MQKDPNILEFCKLIENEESAVEYATHMELLINENTVTQVQVAEGRNTCSLGKEGCDGQPVVTTLMRTNRKTQPIVRCKKCRRYRSTRNGINDGVVGGPVQPGAGQLRSFFSKSPDANGISRTNLSIQSILLMLYTWSKGLSMKQIHSFFGEIVSYNHSCLQWANFFREITLNGLNDATPMGGPGEIVLIDESLMKPPRVRRKGVIRNGKNPAINPQASQNYGDHIEGPWIFGMIWKRPDDRVDLRMFYLQLRDEESLVPIIKRHVEPGTTVLTDEWAAYKNLSKLNYNHQIVSHKQSFVDPITGTNTQRIESVWGPTKTKLLTNWRGKTFLLPRLLAETWWKGLHTETPYLDILEEIRRQYPLRDSQSLPCVTESNSLESNLLKLISDQTALAPAMEH